MQFALVSTVDSMGPEFGSHEVVLFESEREAILYAAKQIVKNDENAAYIESEDNWVMGDDHWDNPKDFLNAWQEGLGVMEYFHIFSCKSS